MPEQQPVAPPRRKPGRPSKLTPELQDEICTSIAAVATFTEACTLAGIERTTAHRWLQKGQTQKRGKYRNFLNAVERAKVQRSVGIKAAIRRHGQRDWKALEALGRITDPVEFTPQVRVHLTTQIDDMLDKIRLGFHDRPELYEQVLRMLDNDAPALPDGEVVDGELVDSERSESGDAYRPQAESVGMSQPAENTENHQ